MVAGVRPAKLTGLRLGVASVGAAGRDHRAEIQSGDPALVPRGLLLRKGTAVMPAR